MHFDFMYLKNSYSNLWGFPLVSSSSKKLNSSASDLDAAIGNVLSFEGKDKKSNRKAKKVKVC